MNFQFNKISSAMQSLRHVFAATVVVASFGVAQTASAAVVYDTTVDHSSQVGTAAGVLAGSLRTGTSSFSGANGAGWAAMVSGLAASDVLLLGQSSRTNNASHAAVKSFVEGGGTVIQLWSEVSSSLAMGSAITGNTFSFIYGGSSGSSITKTANAAGTSFAGATPVATLTGASNHGGITTGSLGSAVSMYENGAVSHVAVQGVGLGTYAFVSWDFCCSASATTRSEWDAVLYSAATYTAAVPLPAGLPLMLGAFAALGLARRRKSTKA